MDKIPENKCSFDKKISIKPNNTTTKRFVKMSKSAKNLTVDKLNVDQKNMMKKACQKVYGHRGKRVIDLKTTGELKDLIAEAVKKKREAAKLQKQNKTT